MRRLVTGTHPRVSPWGKVFALYDDGQIFMFTDLTASAGKGRSLPAWETTGYDGYWLAPSTDEQLTMNSEAEVGCDLMRSPSRGVSWSTITSQADAYGKQAAFDVSNRNIGWAIDFPTGTFTASHKQEIVDSGMPSNGSYTFDEASGSAFEYHCDYLPVHIFSSSTGGQSWTNNVAGYVGQFVPVRAMLNLLQDEVHEFGGYDTITDPGHSDAEWAAAMPLMTMSYALANGFGGGYNYDGADAPDIAELDRWDTLAGTHDHRGFWVQDNTCLTSASNLVFITPTIQDALMAPFGDGSGCYVVLSLRYPAGSGTHWMGGSIYTPVALAPMCGYPGAVNLLVYEKIPQTVVVNVPTSGSYSHIDLVMTDDPLRVAADPTDTSNLYIVADTYALCRVTWPSTTPEAIAYPMAASDTYAANVAVSSSGTVMVSWIGDNSGSDAMYVFRSTTSGSSWDTIDLTEHMPASWWCDTLQVSETTDGTLAMVLSSGKCLFSTSDGASWAATATLAPQDTTILSVEAT